MIWQYEFKKKRLKYVKLEMTLKMKNGTENKENILLR